MIDAKLLEILACPVCKGGLIYDRDAETLTCKADKLVFPIRDDIPVMLVSEASDLVEAEDVSA